VYAAPDVEKTAQPLSGPFSPPYPQILQWANIEGVVHASFVVDSSGVADSASVKIIESSHPLFTNAVRKAIPSLRFRPAIRDGRKVAQLVEMPFTFKLRLDQPLQTPHRSP
jgi:periplasmic protein TonB